MKNTRWLTETALLAALITVTGAVKFPGIIPGTEFQLSAPLAVAICAVFGFAKYITAGLISSVVGLMLGTQTVINVFIAMIFRVTVGVVLAVFGASWPVVVISGPLGSTLARLAMSVVVGKGAWALVLAAVPGMVYTALGAWPLTILLKRVRVQIERMTVNVIQRLNAGC